MRRFVASAAYCLQKHSRRCQEARTLSTGMRDPAGISEARKWPIQDPLRERSGNSFEECLEGSVEDMPLRCLAGDPYMSGSEGEDGAGAPGQARIGSSP